MLRVIFSSDELSTTVSPADVAGFSYLISAVAVPASVDVTGADELPQAARERVITPANSVETNLFIFITPLLYKI